MSTPGSPPAWPRAVPGWRLAAHLHAEPPPPDWREALARRLGQRPRRIGLWAELALYGARECLDLAGEACLPPQACLRVLSLSGSQSATRLCAEQCRAGTPMPFTFMQSQPSQMLAALAQHLQWQGDGSFLLGRDPALLLRWSLREAAAAGRAGLLIGRVEEDNGALATEWWRWVPDGV